MAPHKKTILGFLPLIIIAGAISLTLAVLNQQQDPRSKANNTSICRASDPSSATDCFNKVNAGQIDVIEITSTINCSSQNECDMPPIRTSRPVTIFGMPNAGAGFRRTNNYVYSIVKIRDSSNVTVSNLLFDEVSNNACSECYGSPLEISNSTNILIDNIIARSSNYHGVSITAGNNITVRNSQFINNGWFGIWTRDANGLVIENNLFQDNKSNAILGNFTSTSETPSKITGNTFIHNHRDVIFFVCGGSGPCSGGQIDITSPTNHLVIEKNIIKDGKIDEYHEMGLGAAGIELNGDTHNMRIVYNLIANNSGSGTALNADSPNRSGIVISNNVIYGNRDGNNIEYPGAQTENNCFDAGCPVGGDWGYRQVGQSIPPQAQITVQPTQPPTPTPTQTVLQQTPTPTPRQGTPTPTQKLTQTPTPTRIPGTSPTIRPTTTPIVSPRTSPTPTIEPTRPPEPSDINQDGRVDILDFNLLSDCYGIKASRQSCVSRENADINNDGVVDGIDYNMFLRSFSGL